MYKIDEELINKAVEEMIRKQKYLDIIQILFISLNYFFLLFFLFGIVYFYLFFDKNLEWTFGNKDLSFVIIIFCFILPFYIFSKSEESSINFFKYETFGSIFKLIFFQISADYCISAITSLM